MNYTKYLNTSFATIEAQQTAETVYNARQQLADFSLECYGVYSQPLFDIALEEAILEGLSLDEIKRNIKLKAGEFRTNFNYTALSTEALANLVIKYIFAYQSEVPNFQESNFGKDTVHFYFSGIVAKSYGRTVKSYYSYLPKLDTIVKEIIGDIEHFKQQLFIIQFNLYQFGNTKSDFVLKFKKEAKIIELLQEQKLLDSYEFTSNFLEERGLSVKGRLNRSVDEEGEVHQNSLFVTGNSFLKNEAEMLGYTYTYKLIQGLCQKVFLNKSDVEVDGLTIANNPDNANFKVYHYDWAALRSPMFIENEATGEYQINSSGNHTDYLFSPQFQVDLVKRYGFYLQDLKLKHRYKRQFSSFDNSDRDFNFVSSIDPSAPFSYYYSKKLENIPGQELTSSQKAYKFIDESSPSPSQLNSYLFNLNKNANLIDKDKRLAMCFTVLAKYGYTIDKAQQQVLYKVLNNGAVTDYDKTVLATSAIEEQLDQLSINRMALGNKIENSILNHFAYKNGDLAIKADKATLYSKEFATPFDIDGYIGRDLNDIDYVIEIKNSASPYYYSHPEKIIESYKLQITYYYRILRPKKGIYFVASLKKGNNESFFSQPVTITSEDIAQFEEAFELWQNCHNFLVNNNFFNFANLIDWKRKQSLSRIKN